MICPICMQESLKGASITCSGQCKRKFHLTCVALSVPDLKRILEKDLKWKCNIKYCFIGNGYNSFIGFKEKELRVLLSNIQSELDVMAELFESYSSSNKYLTNELDVLKKEFTELKDRYNQGCLQENELPNRINSFQPVTLDELVSNGWVASKDKRLIKKSFEFENGRSAISFINRTSKKLDKEAFENMPQITLLINTVTIILASSEEEDTIDNTIFKTANIIDGAAPRIPKKNRPQMEQKCDKPQIQREDANKPQFQNNYDNKPQVKDNYDNGSKTEQDDDNESQSDEDDDDDDDDDSESRQSIDDKPCYFY